MRSNAKFFIPQGALSSSIPLHYLVLSVICGLLSLLLGVGCSGGSKGEPKITSEEQGGPTFVEEQSLLEPFGCLEPGVKVISLIEQNNPKLVPYDPNLDQTLYTKFKSRLRGTLTDVEAIKINGNTYVARNTWIKKKSTPPRPSPEGSNPVSPYELAEGTSVISVTQNGETLAGGELQLGCPVRELRFLNREEGLKLFAGTDCGIFEYLVEEGQILPQGHFVGHRGVTSFDFSPDGSLVYSTLAGDVYKWIEAYPSCDLLIYRGDLPKFRNSHSGETERAFKIRSTDQNIVFMTKAFGDDSFNIRFFMDLLLKIIQMKFYNFDCHVYIADHHLPSLVKQFELKQVGSGYYYCNDFAVTKGDQIAISMKVFDFQDANEAMKAQQNGFGNVILKYFTSLIRAWDGVALFNQNGKLNKKITFPKLSSQELIDFILLSGVGTVSEDAVDQLPQFTDAFPSLGFNFMSPIESPSAPDSPFDLVIRGIGGYFLVSDLSSDVPKVEVRAHLGGKDVSGQVTGGIANIDFDYVQSFAVTDDLYEVGLLSNFRKFSFQENISYNETYGEIQNIWMPQISAGQTRMLAAFDSSTQNYVDPEQSQQIDGVHSIEDGDTQLDKLGDHTLVHHDGQDYLLAAFSKGSSAALVVFDLEYQELDRKTFSIPQLANSVAKIEPMRPLIIVGDFIFFVTGSFDELQKPFTQIQVFKLGQGAQLESYIMVEGQTPWISTAPMFLAGGVQVDEGHALFYYGFDGLGENVGIQRVNASIDEENKEFEFSAGAFQAVSGALVTYFGPIRMVGDKIVLLKKDFSIDVFNSQLEKLGNSGIPFSDYAVEIDLLQAIANIVSAGQQGMSITTDEVELLSGLFAQMAVVGQKVFVNVLEFEKYNSQLRGLVPRLIEYDLESGHIVRYPHMELTSIFSAFGADGSPGLLCATGITQGLQCFDPQK